MNVLTGQAVVFSASLFDVDGSPLSGKSNSDISKTVYRNGAVDGSVNVTFTDVGSSGVYSVSLTPGNDGQYSVIYQVTGHDEIYSLEFQADTDKSKLGDVYSVNFNRLKLDVATQTLKLYAADGVTVLKSWPISTKDGENVTTQFGAQVERGVPT